MLANDKLGAPPIIAISGVKNSGKTTLIVRLLPLLRARGLNVAVIKHDGHEFIPDREGTDSDQFRKAGAQGVAVYSKSQTLIYKKESSSPEALRSFFSTADLVLLEGAKNSSYPKIEIVREAISSESICNPSTLLALCTDTELQLQGIPILSLDDYHSVVELVMRFKEEKVKERRGIFY